jgi:hypothetical protein
MYKRMHGFGKGRLKRNNFATLAKSKIRSVPVLTEAKPKFIHTVSTVPPWAEKLPELRGMVPNIIKKGMQTNPNRE